MSAEYQLGFNLTEVCRCCLARNCQLNTMFRCDIIDDEILAIPKVFESITELSIDEEDTFPQNICASCESKLIDSYLFKKKCSKSLKLLEKILKIPKPKAICKLESEASTSTARQGHVAEPTKDGTQFMEPDTSVQNMECTDETEDGTLETYIVKQCEEEDDEFGIDDGSNIFGVDEQFLLPDAEKPKKATSKNYSKKRSNKGEIEFVPAYEETGDINSDTSPSVGIECLQCGERFSIEDELCLHECEHLEIASQLINSINYYRCSRCCLMFPHIDHLIEHIEGEEICEHANSNEADSCCDYQYLDDIDYRNVCLYSCHKDVESDLVVCDLCHNESETFTQFCTHFEKSHIDSVDYSAEQFANEAMHWCGICRKAYKNLKMILQHVFFHQTEFFCPEESCNQSFEEFELLNEHMNADHNIAKDNLRCCYCSYNATNGDDLKLHKKELCKARIFKCNYCEKTFFRRSTQLLHTRTHTGVRPYKCTFNMCGKSFMQTNDLKNHERIHTLERPYKCKECGASFKTIGQRNGHMSTHTTEQNFQCEVCKKYLKSKRILRGHKRLHAEPQFNCTLCERKFNRRYHLTLHMQRLHKPTTILKKEPK